MAVQELLLADPRKAREVAVIDRLVNLVPHEGIQELAKQAEPGSTYAAIESQARLFARWLGFEIDDDSPFWLQFPPRPGNMLAVYEAVRASHERLAGADVLTDVNETLDHLARNAEPEIALHASRNDSGESSLGRLNRRNDGDLDKLRSLTRIVLVRRHGRNDRAS